MDMYIFDKINVLYLGLLTYLLNMSGDHDGERK